MIHGLSAGASRARGQFIAVCFAGLALFLAGCGGSNTNSNTPQTPSPTTYPPNKPTAAPAAPANKGAMMGNTSGKAMTGEQIFAMDCGRCHKIGSVGTGRISLDHIGSKKDKAWLTVQIRTPAQHHSRMPPFPASRLSDKDLATLLTYLSSQK
ncbi:MAG TPA: cytochrome c [Armatimonadota bacterium]|nr:cytochrome c [Armatimonadota bacterium]